MMGWYKREAPWEKMKKKNQGDLPNRGRKTSECLPYKGLLADKKYLVQRPKRSLMTPREDEGDDEFCEM